MAPGRQARDGGVLRSGEEAAIEIKRASAYASTVYGGTQTIERQGESGSMEAGHVHAHDRRPWCLSCQKLAQGPLTGERGRHG